MENLIDYSLGGLALTNAFTYNYIVPFFIDIVHEKIQVECTVYSCLNYRLT